MDNNFNSTYGAPAFLNDGSHLYSAQQQQQQQPQQHQQHLQSQQQQNHDVPLDDESINFTQTAHSTNANSNNKGSNDDDDNDNDESDDNMDGSALDSAPHDDEGNGNGNDDNNNNGDDDVDEEEEDDEEDEFGAGGAFANVAQGLTGAYRNMMMQYWQETINSIEHDEHDFKNHQLPLARIKKVMKTDEEVRMISAEAPILFAKGCDIFITELTMRAWIHAEEMKRRTLQRSDIAAALQKSDMFDFLIDIVPRDEEKPKKAPPPQAQAHQLYGNGVGSSSSRGNSVPNLPTDHPRNDDY